MSKRHTHACTHAHTHTLPKKLFPCVADLCDSVRVRECNKSFLMFQTLSPKGSLTQMWKKYTVGGGDETDHSVDERRRLSGSLLLFVWLCPHTALKTARQYTSQFFYDLEGIRGDLRSTMVSLNMWEHVRYSELTSVETQHSLA